jgi:hypothetical protein
MAAMKLNEPMKPDAKKAKPFDAAKYLDSDVAIAEYPAEALDTGDRNTFSYVCWRNAADALSRPTRFTPLSS